MSRNVTEKGLIVFEKPANIGPHSCTKYAFRFDKVSEFVRHAQETELPICAGTHNEVTSLPLVTLLSASRVSWTRSGQLWEAPDPIHWIADNECTTYQYFARLNLFNPLKCHPNSIQLYCIHSQGVGGSFVYMFPVPIFYVAMIFIHFCLFISHSGLKLLQTTLWRI